MQSCVQETTDGHLVETKLEDTASLARFLHEHPSIVVDTEQIIFNVDRRAQRT